jgi:apolipoprotein N-acyltransferase
VNKPNNMLIFLSPLASAALMLLSFPPFELYVTPFVALVPLIFLIDHSRSTTRAAAGTFMFGMAFWLGLLYWITLFTRAGYLVTALIMSGVMAIFALIVRRLRDKQGIPLTLSIPLVWTAASYVHAHGDIAFPWGQLSQTLTYAPVWLQMASVTGPYGVTMWLACINAVVYGLITVSGRRKNYASWLAILLAIPLCFGAVRFILHPGVEAEAGTLRVAFIQPSIPQDIKWMPEMRDSTFFILRNLSLGQKEESPQLVVWPEAATPAHLRIERKYQRFVGNVAIELDALLLTGAPEYQWDSLAQKYRSYNSAFSFSHEGRLLQSYDKTHLVPVSERFPWEDVFTFLQDLNVGGSHFVPGDSFTVFEMEREDEHFGVLICFESIFPEISRKFVNGGARFLVNITNDAWFERTPAAYQHSSFLVLRAIEQGRDIVRAANTGESCFYDRLGRRRRATELFELAATTDTIHTYSTRTLYSRLGDWPAHVAWVGTLLLICISWYYGRKEKK